MSRQTMLARLVLLREDLLVNLDALDGLINELAPRGQLSTLRGHLSTARAPAAKVVEISDRTPDAAGRLRTSVDSGDSVVLVGSRGRGSPPRHRSPREPSQHGNHLTEPELIQAHGGLVLLEDQDGPLLSMTPPDAS